MIDRAAVAFLLAGLAFGCDPASASVAATPGAEAPRIVRLEVTGVSAYEAVELGRILQVKVGASLTRDPAALAAVLEERYRDDGYPAARVAASWDASTGRLALSVDEGRLAEVAVEGVRGRAAERAQRTAGLAPGSVLREADIESALDRLAEKTRGAVVAAGSPGWDVAQTPAGSRLTLRLAAPVGRIKPRLHQPPGYAVYNRIDGVAPWLGVEALVFDHVSYNHLSLYGSLTHGTASGATRFALGARRGFGPGGRLWLGYEFHDLADTDDVFRGSGLQEALRTLLLRSSFRDYYRRRGHEAYAFLRLAEGCAHLGLSYRADEYESLVSHADGSLFNRSRTPRPNLAIDAGPMHSLIATARWARGSVLFDDAGAETASFLLPSLYGTLPDPGYGIRAGASLEIASRGLGGAFTFTRAIAALRTEHPVAGPISLGTRLIAGLTDGAPPLQKRLALGGRNALPAYGLKEFPGENMIASTIELTWHQPSPWPAPAVFYDGGAVWGEATAASGWRSDIGFGLRWPGTGRVVVRADFSFALGHRR